MRDQGVPVAASLLFFGCRNREPTCSTPTSCARPSSGRGWSGWRTLSPAARRAAAATCSRPMLDCADEVWGLLQQEAAVFVCGNASTIAPGVRASLTAIHHQHAGGSVAEDEGWLASPGRRPLPRRHLGWLALALP